MSGERIPQRYKETLQKLGVPLATVGLLVLASLSAFTKKQRDSIVFDRDEGKCQHPDKHHNCRGGLHCHHIIPQRYAEKIGIEDADYAENGLTICEESHNGPDGVHPDMHKARRTYDGTGKSYERAFEERDRKLERGEIYWDDTYDRQFHAQAVKRTQKAKKRGWVFPTRRKKK